MRHIDSEEVRNKIPKEWTDKARLALDEVRAAGGSSEAVKSRTEVWRELKPVLEQASYNKCWYCESSQHRSDNAIDHYRPKGRSRSEGHDGYWWLAFEWQNLRYSCTYCNSRRTDETTGVSGGKDADFPLFNPGQRARREGDDISIEQPYLLDPMKEQDPGLLWYEPDGRAVPKYSRESYERRYLRADESIRLYHLNYYKTQEDRQRLYNRIRDIVGEGDTMFRKAGNDVELEAPLSQLVIRPLLNLIKPSAVFSAAARAFLLGFKDKPWIESVLSTS